MKPTQQIFPAIALVAAVTAAFLAGGEKKSAPIALAGSADQIAGSAAPGLAETKAIAGEAFICGLPIAMNYAVMNAGQGAARQPQQQTSACQIS